MTTIKAEVMLHAKREYDSSYSYHVFSTDMSEYGYIPVISQDVAIEIPDNFNPVPAEIEMLRKVKQRVQAEAQVKVNALDDQIQKLLCLEYKPGERHEQSL